MEKFYVTFGYGHLHQFNGITIDQDIAGVIEAESEEKAREIVFSYFGDKFFTTYNEATFEPQYFPRGIFKIN